MFCTNCGAKNLDIAKFCAKCGQPIYQPVAQQQQIVATPVPQAAAKPAANKQSDAEKIIPLDDNDDF